MGNDALVPDGTSDGSLDDVVERLSDSAVGDTSTPQPQNAGTKPEWIDEKFWTGDLEESASKQHSSYQSLQTAYGRMANDLGTQRKITDQLLDVKRVADLQQNTPAQPQIDGVDLLDKPTETLDAYMAPRLQENNVEVNRRLQQIENSMLHQAFVAEHPDYQEISQDPEFSKFLDETQFRQSAAQAAIDGNWGVASELMDEFKNRQRFYSDEDKQALQSNHQAARSAGLESAANSSTGTSSGKTYSRADLIRLKLESPEVYQEPSFQADIIKAYQEGRVK